MAAAPTLTSCLAIANCPGNFLATVVLYLNFALLLSLIELTTPLPSLPKPNGVNNNHGSAISILTNSAPNILGLDLIKLPTSFISIDIGPSSNR